LSSLDSLPVAGQVPRRRTWANVSIKIPIDWLDACHHRGIPVSFWARLGLQHQLFSGNGASLEQELAEKRRLLQVVQGEVSALEQKHAENKKAQDEARQRHDAIMVLLRQRLGPTLGLGVPVEQLRAPDRALLTKKAQELGVEINVLVEEVRADAANSRKDGQSGVVVQP